MDFALNLFIIIADQFMLFIINLLVARYAGEELFGDFSVATNALLLIASILTFGIDSIIAYYIPKFYVQGKYQEIHDFTYSVKSFLFPIYRTLTLSGIFLSIAIIILSYAIPDIDIFEISHPFFLFVWGAVVLSLYTIFTQFFRAINYTRTSVLLSLGQTICYFILSLFTYFYLYTVIFHNETRYFPHMMLIAFLVSYVLIVLLSFALERRTTFQRLYNQTIEQHVDYFEWKKKMYGYTIQGLSKYIFFSIPLIVLEWLGPNEESVGLFSAIISIVSLALIAINPIGILISTDISSAFAQSREVLRKTVIQCLWISFALSLIIVAILASSAEKILLLYQSNYIRGLPYTYYCLTNVVIYAVSLPLSKMLQAARDGSRLGGILTIYLLISQVIASIILIPRYGLAGAVGCYVGMALIYTIALAIITLRIYYRPYDYESA